MANTFELISSTTVGAGGSSSIDFNTILPNWTDLCLKVSARGSIADLDIQLAFNGSTTSFTGKRLYGAGSGSGVSDSSARTAGLADQSTYTANTFSNNEIYIPNYASSNYKSYSVESVTENNATQSYALIGAGLWSNNAAITSISLTFGGNNFAQYTTAYLYGVKNA